MHAHMETCCYIIYVLYIHTYIQTDRQTDRQTDTYTYTHRILLSLNVCKKHYNNIHSLNTHTHTHTFA